MSPANAPRAPGRSAVKEGWLKERSLLLVSPVAAGSVRDGSPFERVASRPVAVRHEVWVLLREPGQVESRPQQAETRAMQASVPLKRVPHLWPVEHSPELPES